MRKLIIGFFVFLASVFFLLLKPNPTSAAVGACCNPGTAASDCAPDEVCTGPGTTFCSFQGKSNTCQKAATPTPTGTGQCCLNISECPGTYAEGWRCVYDSLNPTCAGQNKNTCKFVPPTPTPSSCRNPGQGCTIGAEPCCDTGGNNYECINNLCQTVPTSPTPSGVSWGYTPTYCDPPANTKIQTALGCIPVGNTTDFVAWFLRWAIGIAGGIAFLLILYSGFQIITSSGDPEKLKAGKELLTSAIAGLILIIFSLFLLRLIGIQILRIPGLQ